MTRLAIVVLVVAGLLAPAAAAQESELRQRIRADQPVATDPATIADGHVDVGPRYVGDRWRLLIHDDRAKSGGGRSVWRTPERTVLQVSDAARLPVPDDPAYRFLGVEPGTPVHVVGQTQEAGVVWVGWNTQDPTVMETIDRGATLRLDGVRGPGALKVYLQSGSFAEPDVLWDTDARSRDVFIDVNTHAHANWVFTKPGVYLVRLTMRADRVDGSTVTDTRDLRFAVGSGTSADDALAARWPGSAPGNGESAASKEAADAGSPLPVVALVAIALVVAGGAAAVALCGRRAKDRARAGRA